jgi:predicted nucleic acid-binding protein
MRERKLKKSIYLDVCCLCRPFDNQEEMRIQLEANAIFLILSHVKQAKFNLIVSPAHVHEIKSSTKKRESTEILTFLNEFGESGKWDLQKTRKRAEELISHKFGVADAAHVAFAEEVSDFFITCDDRLERKCEKMATIHTMNPVEFVVKEGLK